MGDVQQLFEDEVTPKKANKKDCVEVLSFLNKKAGRNYRECDLNLTFIKARLDSGMTVEDLKAIVAMKCREWSGDEVMNKFLRPATLFNREKCEQYYGEIGQ